MNICNPRSVAVIAVAAAKWGRTGFGHCLSRISLRSIRATCSSHLAFGEMREAKTWSGALIRTVMTAMLAGAEPLTIKIGYVGRAEKKATISLLDYPPDNDGVAGARLALEDNNTTGKFLNQRFVMEEARVKDGTDPTDAILRLADHGISFFIVDLSADMLLKAAETGRGRGLVFFNAGAIDDRLREEDCRADVIHTAPTRSM